MSARVAELKDGGVQGLPLEGLQRLRGGGVPLSAIARVADHRAPDMGKMDADLMGAAGAELGPDQAGDRMERRAEALFQPVFGEGPAAAGLAHGHALAVDRMAADRDVDGALPGGRRA